MCQCDGDYIRSTKQRIKIRIKQKVGRELRRRSQTNNIRRELAIVHHSYEHYVCRTNYSEDRFSAFHKAWCQKNVAILTLFRLILCR